MESSSHVEYNSTSPGNGSHWFKTDFGDFPFVYPITLHYLYPVIVFGRIMHIFWYSIGMIGNILSLHVWMIPRMRRLNKSALYLVSLTVCDITIQILHVFSYLKYFWGFPALGLVVFCEVWNVFNMIPQYSSQMLVLGFTIERFISIYSPFKSERFSKRHRAPRMILVIVILAISMSLIQGYFWSVDGRGFCELRSVAKIDQIYFIWSLATEIVFYFVIPLVTLLLNIYVLKETCTSFHGRDMDSNDNVGESRVHRKTTASFRPATVTLVSISFFRMGTQLPISVTYILQNVEQFSFGMSMPLTQMQHDAQWRSFLSYWGARIIVEAIGVSYHALSVFIFCLSTKQFRTEVKRLFRHNLCFGNSMNAHESNLFKSGYGQSISRSASKSVKTKLYHHTDGIQLLEKPSTLPHLQTNSKALTAEDF